jgi:hypothetical protein
LPQELFFSFLEATLSERKKKLVFCYGEANDCLAKAAKKSGKFFGKLSESKWKGIEKKVCSWHFIAFLRRAERESQGRRNE